MAIVLTPWKLALIIPSILQDEKKFEYIKSKYEGHQQFQRIYEIAKPKFICDGGDKVGSLSQEGVVDALKEVLMLFAYIYPRLL